MFTLSLPPFSPSLSLPSSLCVYVLVCVFVCTGHATFNWEFWGWSEIASCEPSADPSADPSVCICYHGLNQLKSICVGALSDLCCTKYQALYIALLCLLNKTLEILVLFNLCPRLDYVWLSTFSNLVPHTLSLHWLNYNYFILRNRKKFFSREVEFHKWIQHESYLFYFFMPLYLHG